jgi:hypothetical protein
MHAGAWRWPLVVRSKMIVEEVDEKLEILVGQTRVVQASRSAGNWTTLLNEEDGQVLRVTVQG